MALRELRSAYRAAGPRGLAVDFGCRAGRKLADLLVTNALVLEADGLNPAFLEFPAGYAHRFLEADEVRRHAGAPGLDLSPEFADGALLKGDRCYGILDGDRLVSYFWYARTPTLVTDELELDFDPGWAYAYKGYTIPEYRGRRLYGYGSAEACRALVAGGARGCVTLVDANNFPSLRSMQRTGYVPVARIWAARLAGRWLIRAGAGCDPYGMALGPVPDRPASTPA